MGISYMKREMGLGCLMSEQRFREMAERLLVEDGMSNTEASANYHSIAQALAKVEAETRAESAREIERLKKHIADEVTCYHGSCLDIRLLKAQLKTIEADTVERIRKEYEEKNK